MTDCRFSVKVGEHFPTLAELGCGTHFRGGFPPIPREIKKQVPFGFAQDGRMGHGVVVDGCLGSLRGKVGGWIVESLVRIAV